MDTTSMELTKRALITFVGAFFYIFLIARLIGTENKAKWFKRRTRYTFFTRRGILGEYINFGYPVTWQGIAIFILIWAVILGFGYWYLSPYLY